MAMGTFLGCAGAYNIEAQVAEVGVCECYQNVAGLPLCHVYAALTSATRRCARGCPASRPRRSQRATQRSGASASSDRAW